MSIFKMLVRNHQDNVNLCLAPILVRHSRVGGKPQDGARRVRHCGLDPQSRGVACDAGETSQHNHQIPLSHQGRGPKPVPVPDAGAEGETRQSHHRVIPSKARNLETPTTHPCPVDSCLRGNDGGGTAAVILASRQYPQGGV